MTQTRRSIQERDVIKVQLESAQEFWLRFQDNLAAKQHLLEQAYQSSRYLHEEQSWAEEELASVTADFQLAPYHIGYRREDAEFRLYLSRIYEAQGDFDKAITVLEPVPKHTLDCPDVYVQLISLYERERRYKQASDTYRKVVKPRYAICLRKLPANYNQFLVCGISSSGRYTANFDEEIVEPMLRNSGEDLRFLKKRSVIRLGFLGTVRIGNIRDIVGFISEERHNRLLERLKTYLNEPLKTEVQR